MSLISLEPEFIVDPSGRIHTGVLLIDGHRIKGIESTAPAGTTRIRLPKKMLLPGFVNVHSHALQRALRGRVEQRSPKGHDDFWSWRTLMYRDAHEASLDVIEAIATLAYLEMLSAGFVAVGEFNYLHHQPSGKPYDDETAISQRLMKAAERVGIRQVLLTCGYQRKNHREKLLPEQQRFGFQNPSEFLAYAKKVRESVQSPLLTHGIAIHSTRACSGPFIEEVSKSEIASNSPFHMHACEQTGEVKEAFDEYGHSPIQALHHLGALKQNTTLIHATHLDNSDIALIARAKAIVGLCPSTERNLGDGLCPIADLQNAGVMLSIGTDQHVRLDPVNELREIEEQERLRLRKRCIIRQILEIGTTNGRRSLGLEVENGWFNEPADLVGVELPKSYEVIGPTASLDEWMVAGNHHDVTDVFVSGTQVVSDRIPRADRAEILRNAQVALKGLSMNQGSRP